jgi:hypothetical protein
MKSAIYQVQYLMLFPTRKCTEKVKNIQFFDNVLKLDTLIIKRSNDYLTTC